MGSSDARPTTEIDFDELHRSLDEARVSAWSALDPVAMAAVSADRTTIATVEAEASGAKPAWDRSGVSYEIRSVGLFAVADEDNVLLRVVDVRRGQAVRRDSAGEIVEEGSERDPAAATFVAWLARGSDGAWRIAEDYLVDDEFPDTLDEFEVGPSVDVDGDVLEMRVSNHNRGVCYVLLFRDTVPIPNCEEVEIRVTNHSARFRYHLDRSERFEAFVLLTRKSGSFHLGLEVDGQDIPIETEISADRVVALWADVPGRASELVVGAVDGSEVIDPADFVLSESRQDRRDYYAGVLAD